MSDRDVTTDLGLGLGLVRWGDRRRDVAACYPDASYGTCENVYAFQRVFFVDDLFTGTRPELAGIGAYVKPSVPEVIFDEVPHAAARALLDAIGCPLAVDVDEATWETGASAVTVCGHPDTTWIQVRGPSHTGAQDSQDPRFGAYNEVEDETWEPDHDAFEDDEG